jgi:hypothetical protein
MENIIECKKDSEGGSQNHPHFIDILAPIAIKISSPKVPPDKEATDLFLECQDMVRLVYKQKDVVRRQNSLIEANKKIKNTLTIFCKKKEELQANGKDTIELDIMMKTLDELLFEMAEKVLGINIRTLK